MRDTILVTGGAGYIGSITTKTLLDNDYKVIVLDTLENGHKDAVDERAVFVHGNVGDQKLLKEIFRNYAPVAIIDFAAYLSVGESMVEPKKYFENNIGNFINMLDCMVLANCKFLIKSSTAAVYGNPKNDTAFPLNEDYLQSYRPKSSSLLSGKIAGEKLTGDAFLDRFIDFFHQLTTEKPGLNLSQSETTMLKIPTSIYGLSKLLDEIVMKKYDKLFGLKSIALRYFNVAGATDDGNTGEAHPVEDHLIPNVISKTINNQPVKIYGHDYTTPDGTAIRDYVSVTDLARAHQVALDFLLKNQRSDVFNIGNGIGYSVLEVIQQIEKTIGKRVIIEFGERRAGDPKKLLASPKKSNATLGWKANDSLSHMIETAWLWHSKHPRGYSKAF